MPEIDVLTANLGGIPGVVDIMSDQNKQLVLLVHATRARYAEALQEQRKLADLIKEIQAGTLDPATLQVTDEGVRRIPQMPVSMEDEGSMVIIPVNTEASS